MERETMITTICEKVNNMSDEKVQALYSFIDVCTKNEEETPASETVTEDVAEETVEETVATPFFVMQKEEYIEAINEQAERCDDLSLLDFVFQLMVKDNIRNGR